MTKEYFVMLNNKKCDRMIPLMDGEDLAQFATEHEALEAANKNPIGEAYGFEVFRFGDGSWP